MKKSDIAPPPPPPPPGAVGATTLALKDAESFVDAGSVSSDVTLADTPSVPTAAIDAFTVIEALASASMTSYEQTARGTFNAHVPLPLVLTVTLPTPAGKSIVTRAFATR
jgi:hypothetical protein